MGDFVGQVLRQLQERSDITVEKSNSSGHWKVRRNGQLLTTVPSTIFEGPERHAVIASLRKAGVDLAPRQPKSSRPKRHKPKQRPLTPYTKKTSAAALDELRHQLDDLIAQVRVGDRDPAFYQKVQEFACGAKREITDLTS